MTDRVIVRNDGSRVVVRTTGPTGDTALTTTHASRHEPIIGADPLTRYGLHPRVPRPKAHRAAVTIERFGTATNDLVASGHGWTASNNSNGNLNDTATYRPNAVGGGGQSIRIQPQGTGLVAFATEPRATAKNMTGKMFRIWLRVDSATASGLDRIQIYIGSGASTLANFEVTIPWDSTDATYVHAGKYDEWYPVHIGPTTANTLGSGTVDWTQVQDLRIRVLDLNNGTQPKVWVGGVEVIPADSRFPTGVVSLTFDDGYESVYTRAYPRMREYGYAGTAYIIRDQIGQSGRLTEAYLDAMAADGWEVACHADTLTQHNQTNGYFDSTQAQRVAEWHNVQGYVQERGWRGSELFAWPRGMASSAMIDEAAQTFSSARTIDDRTIETVPPADPMRLRAISLTPSTVISPDTTTGSILYKIARAKLYGGWVNLVFHDIVASGATGIQIDQSTFDTILAYCSTNSVPVRPVGDVLQV